jgi:predicted RNase H-like HicB family nuclease
MNEPRSGNFEGIGTLGITEERLRFYLSVPYVAVIYSVVNESGDWVRHAEYPELPNCEVDAPSAIEAMEQLEDMRLTVLAEMLMRGQEPPVPRAPLKGGTSGLSSETLAKQLDKVCLK